MASLFFYGPPNDGFFGGRVIEVLPAGTRIDRYGDNDGRYFVPEGTPF